MDSPAVSPGPAAEDNTAWLGAVLVVAAELTAVAAPASPWLPGLSLAAAWVGWPLTAWALGRSHRGSGSLAQRLVLLLAAAVSLQWLCTAVRTVATGREVPLSWEPFGTAWLVPAVAAWALGARAVSAWSAPLLLSAVAAVACDRVLPWEHPALGQGLRLFPVFVLGTLSPPAGDGAPQGWGRGFAGAALALALSSAGGAAPPAVPWGTLRDILSGLLVAWSVTRLLPDRRIRWIAPDRGAAWAVVLVPPWVAALTGSPLLDRVRNLGTAPAVAGTFFAVWMGSSPAVRAAVAWFGEWLRWLLFSPARFPHADLRLAGLVRDRAARADRWWKDLAQRRPGVSEAAHYLAVAGALVLVGEFTAGSVESPLSYALGSTTAFAVSAGLVWALVAAGDSLLQARFITAVPATLVVVLLGLINREKVRYLSVPVFPSDFVLVKEVWSLLPTLARAHSQNFLLASAVITGLVTLAIVRAKQVYLSTSRRPPSRWASVVAVLFLFAWSFTAQRESVLSWAKLEDSRWVPLLNARTNGFLLSFARALPAPRQEKVQPPPESVISGLTSTPGGPRAAPREMDLVILMSESFWDVEQLPGLEFQPAVLPTVRATSSGTLFSPTLGGGTSNVEFELLTGFSNAFLPLEMVPYHQLVYQKFPSVMWALKSRGFRTVALHPFHKAFWRRDVVYSLLGFDEFIALEDMPDIPLSGLFASDGALADRVLSKLEASPQPAAIFAITMQNHGPYDVQRYASPRVTLGAGSLAPGHAQMVQTYAHGLLESDEALSRLMDSLRKRQRPTLLVFFGDHAPFLGEDEAVYRATGLVSTPRGTPLSSTEYQRVHQTPLVVWRSDTGQSVPVGTSSPSLLPPLLFEQLGLEHPYYRALLARVREEFHVLDRFSYRTADGTWIEPTEDASGDPLTLRHLRGIQYDLAQGSRSLQRQLFPELGER